MSIKNMKVEDLMNSKVYNMCDILRFSTRKRLHEESVATHSFIVTYQAMVLGEVLELNDSDKLLLMQMAVCHDLEEIFTTDVISPVKKAIPELEAALTKYGRENVTKEFGALDKVLDRFYEEEDLQTALWQVMKLADYLSVLYYVDRELEFGSKAEDIMEIKVEMTKTCRELWEKIKNWDMGKEEQKEIKPEPYASATDLTNFNSLFLKRGVPKYLITKPWEDLSDKDKHFFLRMDVKGKTQYEILDLEIDDLGIQPLPIKNIRIYIGNDEMLSLPISCVDEVVWAN